MFDEIMKFGNALWQVSKGVGKGTLYSLTKGGKIFYVNAGGIALAAFGKAVCDGVSKNFVVAQNKHAKQIGSEMYEALMEDFEED